MNTQTRNRVSLAVLAAALFVLILSAPASAADQARMVGVGDAPPVLVLRDQHDKPGRVGKTAKKIVFAPDRDSGRIARVALEPAGAEALERAGIRYIADISRMPGFATRTFALPTMRGYSFPVLLTQVDGQAGMLPRRTGQVTVLTITDGLIADVAYFRDSAALAAALGLD